MKEYHATNDAPRQPHEQPRYLVNDGPRRVWVQCPVCLAQADGWWEGGVPRYTGGAVHCRDPKTREDHVAACICHVGRARRERLNIPRTIEEMPPGTEFLTRPAPIAYKRGASKGPPPPTTTTTTDEEREIRQKTKTQFDRYESGEIDLPKLHANLAAIERKHAAGGLLPPPLEEIIADPALRGLYFDAIEAPKPQSTPVPDWREGMSQSTDSSPDKGSIQEDPF